MAKLRLPGDPLQSHILSTDSKIQAPRRSPTKPHFVNRWQNSGCRETSKKATCCQRLQNSSSQETSDKATFCQQSNLIQTESFRQTTKSTEANTQKEQKQSPAGAVVKPSPSDPAPAQRRLDTNRRWLRLITGAGLPGPQSYHFLCPRSVTQQALQSAISSSTGKMQKRTLSLDDKIQLENLKKPNCLPAEMAQRSRNGLELKTQRLPGSNRQRPRKQP